MIAALLAGMLGALAAFAVYRVMRGAVEEARGGRLRAELECNLLETRYRLTQDEAGNLRTQLERYREAEAERAAGKLTGLQVFAVRDPRTLGRQVTATMLVEDCEFVEKNLAHVQARIAHDLAKLLAREIAQKWIPAEPKGDPSGS